MDNIEELKTAVWKQQTEVLEWLCLVGHVTALSSFSFFSLCIDFFPSLFASCTCVLTAFCGLACQMGALPSVTGMGSFGAHLLCQVQTLWPHLLVLFMFLHWIQSNMLDSPGLFAVQVHHGSSSVTFCFMSYGILPWLGGTVSCVIGNIIWWHKSLWYCPFSSCHSVQMRIQINCFPSGFSFQGLHVITCEMWPKPRGVGLMDQKLSSSYIQYVSVDCESSVSLFVIISWRNRLIFW